MIQRQEYLDTLIRLRDKQLIKVVTGIRRCGKSTLFELFRDYLKADGVTEDQIIAINLEDGDYDAIQTYKQLYDYVKPMLLPGKMMYIFLDEVHFAVYPKLRTILNRLENKVRFVWYNGDALLGGRIGQRWRPTRAPGEVCGEGDAIRRRLFLRLPRKQKR